ncbi:Protein CELLULOSE SYNTHASE INTERACTIVE 1 [Frankliniella fusca]|uniref:Protein CELLULOSE SYNTHASE INTERACTIVE 1 n=1 Tax=Frankliniella fusca TaxID=407009 RepID=A0AAE1H8W6_9NEOP|nr:Protein CELLULOSE SYNTHASE INTERACTIVE 1 [Frankliniella fusca]
MWLHNLVMHTVLVCCLLKLCLSTHSSEPQLMASQLDSLVVIKDDIFKNDSLDSSVDTTDSCRDLKVSILNAMKEEEGNAAVQHVESFHPKTLICNASTPPVLPSPNLTSHSHLVKRPEVTPRECGVPLDILLQLTLP